MSQAAAGKKKNSLPEEVIFFDLDDTLYRRLDPFAEAAGPFFASKGIFLSSEELETAFLATQKRCEEVFAATQRGELSKVEGFVYRYAKGFEDVGIVLSREEALKFRDAYQEAQKHIKLRPEVRNFLKECRKTYSRTGIISNGQSDHQRAKIRALGLEECVDPGLTVISGEIGIDKPDPGIFQYAQKLAGLPAEQLTYVGDSMETDILPAQKAGWKTISVNRDVLA